MNDVLSLTQDEARERAALLDVHRYDLELDLTGLADGDALRATSTIVFSASTPGATTFVDCVGEVEEAELNGRAAARRPDAGRASRAARPAGATTSSSSAPCSAGPTPGRACTGPSIPATARSTSGPPSSPTRPGVVFACFDQPDLKAVLGITVHVPERWLVTSNTGDAEVSHRVTASAPGRSPTRPRLSTYVVVVNAGPFHELRSTRRGLRPRPVRPALARADARARRRGAVRR